MTYKEKIQTIKSFKTYLLGILVSVPNVRKVSGNRIDILTCYEYPLVVCNYVSGDQYDYREAINATATYEITVIQNVEDESDVLDICADIASLFETVTHGGRVIGCKIGLPQNFYEQINNALNVKSVMEVEIEI